MSYVYKQQDLEVEWVDGELNCLSQPMCATECGHRRLHSSVERNRDKLPMPANQLPHLSLRFFWRRESEE